MVTLGKMIVSLQTDSNEWVRGMRSARDSTKDFKATVTTDLNAALGTFAAVTAGIGTVAAALGSSIKQAAEEERAFIDLKSALKATGQDAEFLAPRYQALSDRAAIHTTHTREQIMAVTQLAVSIGGLSERQLPEAVSTAIGLSRALHMELEPAMRLVLRAMAGNYTMLQRYLPELRNMKDPAEKWAAVAKKAAEGVSAEADAMGGLSASFGKAKDETNELLGLLGTPFIDGLKAATQGWTNFIRDIRLSIKVTKEELNEAVAIPSAPAGKRALWPERVKATQALQAAAEGAAAGVTLKQAMGERVSDIMGVLGSPFALLTQGLQWAVKRSIVSPYDKSWGVAGENVEVRAALARSQALDREIRRQRGLGVARIPSPIAEEAFLAQPEVELAPAPSGQELLRQNWARAHGWPEPLAGVGANAQRDTQLLEQLLETNRRTEQNTKDTRNAIQGLDLGLQ